MIFVDSNVFIYAVGRPHPLRDEARSFFLESARKGDVLTTSVEVLQELMHVYLPVRRLQTLDEALALATRATSEVLSITRETVEHARALVDRHPGLTARDLLHLSVCQLNRIKHLKTFDRGLDAAFGIG